MGAMTRAKDSSRRFGRLGTALVLFGAAVGFSTLIVACFALGVRLLTNAQNIAPKARKGNAQASQEEALNLVGAYLLFAVCACALA